MRAMAVVFAALLLVGCDQEEARTIPLKYLQADAALQLVQPYLGEDAVASVLHSPPLITVRGRPALLDDVERVIAQYDRPAVVRFRFQIVEADGFTATDTAIADVEAALRDLFRFRGYRLAAQAVAQAEAPGTVRQQVIMPDGLPVMISVNVSRVLTSDEGAAVAMEVDMAPLGRSILSTSLTVPSGKTAVVGSAQADADKPTLILVVRPEIQ